MSILVLDHHRTNPCPCPFSYAGSSQNNTSPQSAPRTQKRLHLIDLRDLCGEPAAREIAFSGEAPPRKRIVTPTAGKCLTGGKVCPIFHTEHLLVFPTRLILADGREARRESPGLKNTPVLITRTLFIPARLPAYSLDYCVQHRTHVVRTGVFFHKGAEE